MPRKYSVEFKEKAVHQIIEMVRLESCSLQRAYTEVGELLGVSHHTLRAWYRDSASVRDDSDASGGETMEEELKRLRRENRELKRANGMADSTGGRNEFRELLRWCQISERLARSAVERVLNRGQVRAANDAQIGALRKVLT